MGDPSLPPEIDGGRHVALDVTVGAMFSIRRIGPVSNFKRIIAGLSYWVAAPVLGHVNASNVDGGGGAGRIEHPAVTYLVRRQRDDL